MTLKGKFKRFFELDDEYEETEMDVDVSNEEVQEYQSAHKEPKPGKKEKQNVVSLSSVQSQARVMLLEPHSYDEVQEISDHLKNRKAVVINLQRLPHEQAKRIVDFLSGTVYAIGGDIQKLGSNIFLCTPDNVDVTGSISEMFQHEG
ncbi:cell division protein SepF [Salisediminibacterium halotolerans]|uniref:Cell division protein SepF n=1 Tax=Salisediminibacterium halotolerans TaxID=517425 RepID=A0A1H9PVP2_9BACI|nr:MULTISPECIES: cell division protein SepF [Salisediminibacterium]RLJ74298.1 cell division inhibitor SepF [Actinophytocola xinjiangensis]RPE87609.1 cell division inhibitor SepF [Salisediminibacterium halotolerans]TWG35135.1 cell division inhibitor SepF [Salisediminibacterium halotolerans]SER52287.1 cell division inhibitor SepF [Salisediminibacterium haloalkalitolerans]GEL07306.1 cell division protein SepF [Salisediminibacterium halotolerans]